MTKRAIVVEMPPRRICTHDVLEAHARATIRRGDPGYTELEVFAGGEDLGPLTVKSTLARGADGPTGIWLSQVTTIREMTALAVASALSEVLGTDGWSIQGVPGLYVLEKELLDPVRRKLGEVV